MPDPGIRVTVEDLATGETESAEIRDDYIVTCAGSCYVEAQHCRARDVPEHGDEPARDAVLLGGRAITRSLEEIETMADAWLADDAAVCPWATGAALIFGGDAAWPLMIYVQKHIAEGEEADPLDDAEALNRLEERLAFLLEKASDERGISAPKAREQVNAYLWLYGRDELIPAALTFAQLALRAQKLLDEVTAVRTGTAAS